MKELIGREGSLNFKTKHFTNSLGTITEIGNSGLYFVNQKDDWTWHYQPDKNKGPVFEKRVEYATVFLAAFGEFISFWQRFSFPEGDKPDLIQSITNPTMANFLIKEFKEAITTTRGNSCCVTFNLPVIEKNELLLNKFSLAKKSCLEQKYVMTT